MACASWSVCGFCERWPRRLTAACALPRADLLAPWYNFCIDKFGAERSMFESNFPMDRAQCSYTVLWNAFKRIATERGCSKEEMAALFGGTAKRVYRLE